MADFTPRVFTQTFGVVGAILEKNGRILLVKESQRKGPDDGKWSQPAGWIDVGEHPSEAVKREVKEETGYTFTPTHLLGVYSLVRKDVEKELGGTPHALKLIYIGAISADQTELEDDVDEVKWFLPEEIYSMNQNTLRDLDIKQEVKDYFSGKRYALDIVVHTIA